MYENHKLCADLEDTKICIVVELYKRGIYIRKFHKHVPKYHLGNERQINLLYQSSKRIIDEPIPCARLTLCSMVDR